MCCGSNRAAARAAAVAAQPVLGSPAPRPSGVSMFELVRGGEATLRGAVTGRLYHFAHAGARLRVDPRDEGGLLGDPRLHAVR